MLHGVRSFIWRNDAVLKPTREVLTLREMQMRVEPCKRVFRLRLWSHFRSRLISPFFSPPWLLERKGSFSGPFSGPNFRGTPAGASLLKMVQCSRCKRACRSTGGRDILESHAGHAERRDSAVWATGLSMCNPVCSAGKCNIHGFSLLRQCAAAVFAPGFAAKSAASRQRRTRTPWWKPLCLGAKKCMGKCQYDEALALSTAKGSAAARGCQDSARLR